MDEDLKQLFASMRQEDADAHAETRRHFEVVAERLEKKLDLLCEGAVARNERLDRLDAKLSAQMARGFDDLRSMLKFPHHKSSSP